VTSETAPVSADEMLIRLIWQGFYKPAEALPVRPAAFGPRPDEIEGISVFRLSCLASAEEVLSVIAAEKREKYGIALLPAGEIFRLGMTVLPAPITIVLGHAVIPELNSLRLASVPIECQAIQMELAKLASANIVRQP